MLKDKEEQKFLELVGAIGDVTEEIIECLQLNNNKSDEKSIDQYQLMDLISMNQ